MADESKKLEIQRLVTDPAVDVRGSQSGNKTSENVKKAIEAADKSKER
jgi:hypothetical protein